MPPTGRSIDLEKLRRKLEEAKSVEERRLTYDVLLSYVEYLRERRRDTVSEFSRYFYAIVVTVPLTIIGLVITVVTHLYLSKLTTLVIKYLMLTLVVICTVLLVLLYLKSGSIYKLENEIYEIYNTLLDPAMKPDRRLDILIAATILTVLAIIAVILAWIWF